MRRNTNTAASGSRFNTNNVKTANNGTSQLMTTTNNLDTVVRESLRSKILSGELDGGFHLSELKISKDYNVSRTPVREALCALAADGLVEMVPHRGAFVTHVPAHTKTDQLQAYSLFLGLAAKMAAEKANIEMLLDLENVFSFASSDADISGDVYLSSIASGLDMIEKIANSPTISEALGMLYRRANTGDVWAYAYGQRKELDTQFTLLLAALKRKKADAAEKTMRQLVTIATNAWMVQRRNTSANTETSSGARSNTTPEASSSKFEPTTARA